MNVIPGVAITVILPLLGKVDEANPAMLKRIDWLHVGSLALFLGRARDYTSLQIGGTVFVTGLTMGLAAPVAARLSTMIDGRYVIAVGIALFATGLWLFSYITPQWGFWELFAPQAGGASRCYCASCRRSAWR